MRSNKSPSRLAPGWHKSVCIFHRRFTQPLNGEIAFTSYNIRSELPAMGSSILVGFIGDSLRRCW